MDKGQKEELKKLSPRERVKKLKELEDQRKKEFSEIDEMIEASMKEIDTDDLASEIAPAAREVNIDDLFEQEQGSIDASLKKADEDEEGHAPKYTALVQDYENLKDLSYASMEGPLSERQIQLLDQIGERISTRKYVSESDKLADLFVASRSVLYQVKKYQGIE
ncbi:hypothetical protein J4212_04555 [Candidatus Woesearchaeota archaeon]|nr:hypothetical protein [Candidatus Woesearchaeota archaeon]